MTPMFRAALTTSLVVLTALSGRQVTGQEPAAQLQPPTSGVPETIELLYQEINEEAIKEPPQRKWEIEQHAGDPIKVPIRRVDAKTLENKFRATFVLVPPLATKDDETSRARYSEALNADQAFVKTFSKDKFERLLYLQPSFLFRTQNLFGDTGLTISRYHAMQLEVCPEDKRPEQRMVEFLTSRQCDNDVVRELSNLSGQMRRWKYTIYAPTEEEAVARAKAIMQLFDYSVCQPLQLRYLAEGRKALEAARKGQEELPKLFDAIRAEEAKRAVPTEITLDILTQLKAQKVMIAIEMAGLDARVKACNELLKQVRDDTRPSAAQTSVSDMKVRAEVELVGSKEKLDRINAFIAEGSERVALDERIATLKSNRDNLRSSVRNYERLASSYAHLVLLYAPMEVGDFKIAPIEWTN